MPKIKVCIACTVTFDIEAAGKLYEVQIKSIEAHGPVVQITDVIVLSYSRSDGHFGSNKVVCGFCIN